MFVALYDKNLNALFKSWSTYATTKWSLVRNAYEFDEVSVTTRAVDNSNKAVFVGLHNNDGSLKYLANCGKPKTKNGETTIKGTDIRQIFKQKVVINLSNVGTYDGYVNNVYKTRLQQIYEYLLNIPLNFSYNGFGSELTVSVDTTDIGEHAPTWNENYIDRTPGVGNVWDVIQAFNMCYDCYVETVVSIQNKTITFRVKRIYNEISFKMSDFDEYRITNDTSVTNVYDVRVKSNSDDNVGTHVNYVYLLANDTVKYQAQLSSASDDDANTLNSALVIYPPRMETILEADSATALSKAYQNLFKNRFQGKAEINTNCAMGYVLRQADFNTFGKIYGYNSADDRDYRRLPLMKISEDNTGLVKVTFGRLNDYWYVK